MEHMVDFPDDMDVDCIKICTAMNQLPGIQTFESCCGHGVYPHRIYFGAKTIESLLPILQTTHSSGWHIEASWANGNNAIYFVLEGPIGAADMPRGADDFASWLMDKKEELGT